MKLTTTLSLLAAGGLSLGAVAIGAARPGVAAPATAAPAVSTFEVDPVHSSLVFNVRYNGVSNFWGRFDEFSGTVDVDPSDPSTTKVDLTVKTASVSTGNEKRDGHLKSPDFFSAKQYPDMRFVSTSAKKNGDGQLEISGKMTMHGETKDVTATATFGGETEARDGTRIGYDAKLKIDRTDFGVSYGVGMLGAEVEIHFGLTAVSKG